MLLYSVNSVYAEDDEMNEEILRQRLRGALNSLNATARTPYRIGLSVGSARLEPHH